jgi:hypothetical protein
MNVVVRTHGGLGNQLFQLLYGRLFAERHGAALFEVHDIRYEHAFARSRELLARPTPPFPARAVSALRLPKVMTRLGMARDAIGLLGTTYLDGYFQRAADYAPFSDAAIREQLLILRQELRVAAEPMRDQGVHLRLGDFFTTEAAVTEHLHGRLSRIGAGAGIVTNEEVRLTAPEIATAIAAAGAFVVPTGDMSPEEVLRTLASFRRVAGNDSTLLFWASVLSPMDCEFRAPELRALRARFREILAY